MTVGVEEGKMRTFILRAVVAVGIVGGTLVALPAPALAAPASNWCPATICQVRATGFPGGTISIDADAHVAVDRVNRRANWSLQGPNGFGCRGSFMEADPPRSWTCRNAPRGSYYAAVTGNAPTAIGIRW
jgi:hypothetical protein